jgi:hypothetical protein
MAAANGPPNTITARTGAAATETTTPRGNRTGSALASRAAAVQYARPTGPPNVERVGKRK